jgi:hypothetical protein
MVLKFPENPQGRMEQADLFFELPLNKWPVFENQALNKAKLVLKYDLTPQVDLFNDGGLGQGLRDPVQAAMELRLNDKDRPRFAGLLKARSYDVYSLRAAMADQLSDDDLAHIKISEADQARLQTYLNNYSRGLLKVLLDGSDVQITSRSSLANILLGAAKGTVFKNIVAISQRLGINPQDIVGYIGRLSEMIMAISYYQRVYDSSLPDLRELLLFVKKMHDTPGIGARFPSLKKDTQEAMTAGRNTIVYLKDYFEQFQKVENFFQSITPEKFKALSDSVENHYRAIGTLLCFWQIRVDQWKRKFAGKSEDRREGTIEQKCKFFKETIDVHFDKITDCLEVVKSAELKL